MRIVAQRVKKASVAVGNRMVGEIGNGLLAFLAVHADDGPDEIGKLSSKLVNLRIFEKNGKMNSSILETKGSILIVSQFTLYADSRKGNRPSFMASARPPKAREYYDHFIEAVRKTGVHVETGSFGEEMEVNAVNDGPVTIILDTNDFK